MTPSPPANQLPPALIRKQNAFSTRDPILFLTIGLISLIVLYLGIGPNRILPGDETRFIVTSQSFADHFGLSLLEHYEEMSTPLPFMVFGLWGKFFGFELWVMRIGAIFITLGTLYQLCVLCDICLKTRRQFWLLGLSLCYANPYFLPMGTMVYTDMIAVFFLLLGLRSYFSSNAIGIAMSCAGMLWCRQYLVFLVLAFGVMQLWRGFCVPSQRRDAVTMCLGVLAGCLPFVWLVWLWGGLTPDNQMRTIYMTGKRGFHITSLVLYCSLIFWFSLPVIFVMRRKLFDCKFSTVLTCLLISQVYWWFPVRASIPSVQIGLSTVGLMHRILNRIDPRGFLADGVYYIGFVFSLLILGRVLKQVTPMVLHKKYTHLMLPICALMIFLLVMPWSYLHWEKYFLPAIPITLLMILFIDDFQIADTGYTDHQ